jgi:hypothetical protein
MRDRFKNGSHRRPLIAVGVGVLPKGGSKAQPSRLGAYSTRGIVILTLKNKVALQALHTGNVKEGISLEYKASPAIDKKDDTKKLEMAWDVAAFANAAARTEV